MMASLRAKAAGRRRSGDGRECGLLKQKPISREVSSSKSTARSGHGAQAAAWNASLSFVKSHSPKAATGNSSSISTSPETDRGASDVFRFFEAGGGRSYNDLTANEGMMEEDKSTRKDLHPELPDSYYNPMFHSATANAGKAVASLFPGDEEPTLAAVNDSNPLFNRTVSESSVAIARSRSKAKREKSKRLTSSTEGGGCKCPGVECCCRSQRSSNDRDVLSTAAEPKRCKDHSDSWKTGCKVYPAEAIKKEKAMYEHVGRMNFRPYSEFGLENEVEGSDGGFRMDTFARNEGDAGGKAHFKFVFTPDGGGSSTEDGRKRPVLDAIHDRDTGKTRVRANDGREISAANSSVEFALANIGAVLFNPRTMAKGHHLYTLSISGRTLFSVLA